MSSDNKGSERRGLYRSTTTQPDVDFEVMTCDGNAFSGEVVGATVEGTGALFYSETAPRLEIGEQTKLAFSAPELAERVEIDATVASCLVQSTRWRYGFCFHQRAEAPTNAAAFYRIFNRRRTHRLMPQGEHLVTAALEVGQSSLECLLRDISAIGAGIVSETKLSTQQADQELASLSFQLPGSERTLRFRIRVCHHTAEHMLDRYGVEFDPAATNDYESQRQEIMQYVMRSLLETNQDQVA